MRYCDDTITVYNHYTDPTTRYQVFVPTVIQGVHWYGTNQATVSNDGLLSADQYIIRVPANANTGNARYVSPKTYENLANKTNYFTFAHGDVIVKGNHVETGENAKPAYLNKTYDNVVTVISITDNISAKNAPHWRVVCK